MVRAVMGMSYVTHGNSRNSKDYMICKCLVTVCHKLSPMRCKITMQNILVWQSLQDVFRSFGNFFYIEAKQSLTAVSEMVLWVC